MYSLQLAQAVHEGIMDAEVVRNIPELHNIWGDDLDQRYMCGPTSIH